MGDGYDPSVAPREGKSAISPETRKRIYGDKGGRRGRPQKKKQQVVENVAGGSFQPDLSNQFAGNVNMTMQDQLTNMANLWGGGGGQQDQPRNQEQTDMLRAMMEYWRDPANQMIRPREAFMAEREAAIGPERTAQENYQARLAGDPWAAGGLFEGRRAADIYTPEEILASQGSTAQNQILRNRMPVSQERREQLSGVPASRRRAGEFDPEELLRQNRIYRANRTYT